MSNVGRLLSFCFARSFNQKAASPLPAQSKPDTKLMRMSASHPVVAVPKVVTVA